MRLLILLAAWPLFAQAPFQCVGKPHVSGPVALQISCTSERNGSITWQAIVSAPTVKTASEVDMAVKYLDASGTVQTEYWRGPLGASRPFAVGLDKVVSIDTRLLPKPLATASFH